MRRKTKSGSRLTRRCIVEHMNRPTDLNLPFFAYGIFRPGQLAFFQLSGFVSSRYAGSIKGQLLLRDGLPIIDPESSADVDGAILEFKDLASAETAYDRVCGLEPDNHYRWGVAQSAHGAVNVLYGRSPRQGSIECDELWDGNKDPLFDSALGNLCTSQQPASLLNKL